MRDAGPSPAHIILAALGAALVMALPAAMAWYRFAARRLLNRLSPLATAIVVGPLPWLAVLGPLLARESHLGWFIPLSVLSTLAAAIVAVWVYERSRGSLLPVTMFLIAVDTVPIVVVVWAGDRFGNGAGLDDLLLGAHCLLALVLVLRGGMWRRPESRRLDRSQVRLVDPSAASAD